MTIRLEVGLESIRFRASAPAVGDIRLEFDGKSFPSRSWNDFVIVILGAMCRAITEVLEGGEGRVELVYFMEGPYTVEVSRRADALLLRAFDRGEAMLCAEGPAIRFASDLAQTAKLVLARSDASDDADMARLRASSSALLRASATS